MLEGRSGTISKARRYTRVAPEVRRRLLIEAATRCLEMGGIKAFTVERIRREAGVSRGLINYHFDSTGDLLVAVYQAALNQFINQLTERIDGMPEDDTDRLGALVEACFRQDNFDRYTFPVWLALWGELAKNAKLRALRRQYVNSYRRLLAVEIARVAEARKLALDAAVLARNFMALFDGLWLEWCQDEELVSPTEAQAACRDLLESKLGPLR
jgi:AcrR family transcriptional regulator